MPKRKGSLYLGSETGGVTESGARAILRHKGLSGAGPVTSSYFGNQREWYSRDVVGRGEHHFVDYSISSSKFNQTGTLALINTIAEGTSTQQRVGRKIVMTGLTFRMSAENDDAAVSNDCLILLVEDMRPIGSLAAITDILESVSPEAMNNEAGFGRFKIHMRKRFNLRGNGPGGTEVAQAPYRKQFDFYKKLRNRKVHYSGATGGIGEIIQGALYLITLGDKAAGTADADLDGSIRISFKDVK